MIAKTQEENALLPPGSIIDGRYRVDAKLAQGGMSIVYRGFHLVLEQPIAIKTLRPEFQHQVEAVERFLSEAKALARLHGPHVPHVLDSGLIDGGPAFMALEYLEGSDLRSVLQQEGPLALPRAVDYVLQACDALAEAHALDMVHRDLKPENLFLTELPDGRELLKVIDFGISKRLDGDPDRAHTTKNTNLGSPEYMAPEQMQSPERVDARADIWALGVVLFELCSGELPFSGQTVAGTCGQVLFKDPVPLNDLRPDLPDAFVAIVERCLCKQPDQRFATIQELAQALAPFAARSSSSSILAFREAHDGELRGPRIDTADGLGLPPHLHGAPTEPRAGGGGGLSACFALLAALAVLAVSTPDLQLVQREITSVTAQLAGKMTQLLDAAPLQRLIH